MSSNNPNDEENDDVRRRIKKLKDEIENVTGVPLERSKTSEECPPEIAEQFWQNVLAFEKASWLRPFDVLIRNGTSLPDPNTLTDEQITPTLWRVINALVEINMLLYNTDHLSDRELYEALWNDILRDECIAKPEAPGMIIHTDMVGSGSEEHIHLWLKYYANEAERKSWAKDWPDEPIPDHVDPPYDRDRRLPQNVAKDTPENN